MTYKIILAIVALTSVIVGLTGSPALAITKNQIGAEVQVVCPDNHGNYYSGSGTIIDSKGIILTNKHVVTDQYGAIIKTCVIGFVSSVSQPPDFGFSPNYHVAEVKYYTAKSGLDAAILYLNNPTSQTYPAVDIWGSDSSSLKFGDKIEVIGFPSIGGSTITYTSGDFSGFGSGIDGTQNYIKTTAQVEHGNSGGAAYDGAGRFVGIPTMVVSGTLNSLSFILSVNSIKQWLSSALGITYKQQVEQAQSPVISNKSSTIQNDITPPFMSSVSLDVYGYDESGEFTGHSGWGDNGSPAIYEFPKVSFGWFQNCNTPLSYKSQVHFGDSCIQDNSGEVAGYFYYFGPNANANPATDGEYIAQENLSRDTIYKNEGLYGYQRKLSVIFSVDKTRQNFFILQAKDIANNISAPLVTFQYIYEPENFKTLKRLSFYKESTRHNLLASYNVDFTPLLIDKGYWYKDSHELFCTTKLNSLTIQWEHPTHFDKFSVKNFNSYTPLKEVSVNGDVTNTNYYTLSNLRNGKYIKIHSWDPSLSPEQKKIQDTEQIYYGFYLKPLTNFPLLSEKHSLINLVYDPKIGKDLECSSPYFKGVAHPDTGLSAINTSGLKGRILLQVQSHGEAWYVNPDDGKRYYMKDGSAAFGLMRTFALGITDKDLTKIPAKDDLRAGDKKLIERMSGKILLQVEHAGDAWYVNPANGKRYFMGKPGDAYNLMRTLGLGITTSDLEKIPIGILD